MISHSPLPPLGAAFAASLLFLQTAPARAESGYAVSFATDPARIRVTSEVINPGLERFTGTTTAWIGNTFMRMGGSGFEPPHFRNRFFAIEDAPDSVVADRVPFTHFDSYAEGFLDGADVMVFRVVNKQMKLVRRDTVAPGGHKSSGWIPILRGNDLVAPDKTSFTGGLEDWGRQNTPYWFAIAGMDAAGRQGALSQPVRVDRPERPQGMKSAPGDKATARFQPARGGQDPGPADIPAPADFKAVYNPETDQVDFSWEAVSAPGLAGYRIFRSDTDPAQHGGYRLDLKSKAASPDEQIKKGDLVFVHKTLEAPSRSKILTKRLFGARGHEDVLPNLMEQHPDENPAFSWELKRHDKTTPVEDAGQYYLRLQLKDSKPYDWRRYVYGPADQTFWPVLIPGKEYEFSFWARSESGPVNAQFELTGFYGPNGPSPVPGASFVITDNWQKFTHKFSVSEIYATGHINQFSLVFASPSVVDVDNIRFIEAGTPFLALTPEDKAAFSEARLGALRTHNFIKTGRFTYDMEQLTNPPGAIHSARGSTGGNTLGQTLSVMKEIGARPWLQIEFFMSPEEWQGFVEFMAAPYDPAKGDTPETKPWAAKRYAQGRHEPWTEAFDRIYFELSNETWNSLFAPWTFEDMTDAATGEKIDRGTVYGLFQEWVIDQLKSSPYWAAAGLDEKFEFVIGGWAMQTDARGYGQRAIAASPRSKHMTIAAYNGGWDEGEGPMQDSDSALQRVLLHAPQVGEPRSRALEAFREKHLQESGRVWFNGVYEAGPGYALSGLNNQAQMTPEEVETQDRAMKSLASGTATLDSFLEKAAHGFKLNNFFTVSRGRNHWTSHTPLLSGGHPHLPFVTIQLFNHEGEGDLLRAEYLSGPAIDAPGYKKREAASNIPLVAAYATRKGDRVNLFVLSRRLDKFPDPAHDGFTPVSIELPFKSAKSLTLHRLTGDPRAHNLDAEVVKIEKLSLPVTLAAGADGAVLNINKAAGADDRGLPPGSAFLYVFEGVQ